MSIRHGTQKWKTRGKTQPDRTQRWDHSSVIFTCYPDCPIEVKVIFANSFNLENYPVFQKSFSLYLARQKCYV